MLGCVPFNGVDFYITTINMKKFRKIVIAGGTGQLGTAITNHFKNLSEEIIILSRTKTPQVGNRKVVVWDAASLGEWWRELEGADMLINLAGKNINCRHNKRNKEEILNSRLKSVEILAAACMKCSKPPELWIQSSSAAIYDHSQLRPMPETELTVASGFLADVCKAWENSFWQETKFLNSIRKVVLRISLVLGKSEGAFPYLRALSQLGLGGMAGNGRQYMSWVHETDVAGMVQWIASHREILGPVNCASPFAVNNNEFMKVLRKELGIPLGIPAPGMLIKIAAAVIGTEASLILDSMWVVPEKLLLSGFEFRYPNLDGAVKDLITD